MDKLPLFACDRFVDGPVCKGDNITIMAQGCRISGTVLSANWYGGKDGWFIEFTGKTGKYHYWKQGPDGGKIIEHKGTPCQGTV